MLSTRGLRVADRVQRRNVALQLAQPFGRGIDRAGDAALGRLPRRAQGHQQIVQQHHRPAGGDADQLPRASTFQPSAGPDQHDVVLLGIDQHVADLLQAAEEADLLGQGLPGLRFRRMAASSPRSETFRRATGFAQFGGNLLQGFGEHLAQLALIVQAGVFNTPSGSMEMPPTAPYWYPLLYCPRSCEPKAETETATSAARATRLARRNEKFRSLLMTTVLSLPVEKKMP